MCNRVVVHAQVHLIYNPIAIVVVTCVDGSKEQPIL